MTTADHSHPEIERMLARLVDFAEATNTVVRDLAVAVVRIEARLDGIDRRLGSIEDALRGPGRN